MMKSSVAVVATLLLVSFVDGAVIRCTGDNCQEKCRYPVDLAIVLESSSLIQKQDWTAMKQSAKTLVDSFDISESQTHVSIMSYSTKTNIVTTFDKYAGQQLNAANIKRDIDGLVLMGGEYNLNTALKDVNEKIFTAQAGMRTKVPKVLVMLTTGIRNYNDLPNDDPTSLSSAIKSKGVEFYSIGVGGDIDVMELIMMATSDEHVFSVRNLSSKQSVMNYVKDKCSGSPTMT